MPERRNRPAEGPAPGAAGRRRASQSTRPDRHRFVDAHPFSPTEIEAALAVADVRQLIRASDEWVANRQDACRCPRCGARRSVTANGRWTWTCNECHALGSWLALRQQVAESVDACVRLALAVHGARTEAA